MNINEARREVPTSELEQIKDKYPQMVQNFEEVKKQAYEPNIQGLGKANGQSVEQQLQNVVWQEQRRLQNQGQTS